MMKTIFIYFIFISIPYLLFSQNAWELRKERNGIKIYNRHSDVSRMDDIKVELDLPGNIYQVADILIDVEKYPQWAYATKLCELIKKVSKQEFIYYSEVEVPWPATNRDFYANFKLTFDSAARSFNLNSTGMKDYRPAKKNLVRVPLSKGQWNVTTISDKKIHLIYILQLDPGGSVPTWVLNLFSTKGPMETFENLKKKMELLNR
ncbi:MAG: hypothetical protein JST75_19480 [Bacteroidetes bacterium]|nr:hypothetical protein [Bacteroidota bacterium]